MDIFKLFRKAWGEWVEVEQESGSESLWDRIAGKQKADQRQAEIEALLDQLSVDSDLSQMRERSGRRSI